MKIKNIFGEFSGSIGAMTFSRNRSGFYVKNRANPVNPNTQKQADARARFAAASNAWNDSLVPREQWSAYGAEVYTSIKGTTGVTGNIAFTANYNAMLGATAKMANIVVAPVVTKSPFVFDKFLTAMYKNTSQTLNVTEVIDWTVDVPEYNSNGNWAVKIKPSKTFSITASPITNLNLDVVGINIYVSKPYSKEGGFVQGELGSMIGSTGLLTSVTDETLSEFAIHTSNPTGPPANIGSWVRMTAYFMDSYGQSAIIGSVEVQVSEEI